MSETLLDKNGIMLYAGDRVALNADEELAVGTVVELYGKLAIELDYPTRKTRIISIRPQMIDGYADFVSLILVYRPQEVHARLEAQDYEEKAKQMTAAYIPQPGADLDIDKSEDIKKGWNCFDQMLKTGTAIMSTATEDLDVAAFLFEVTRVTDTKTGMGLSLEEVMEKHDYNTVGPGNLTVGSTDKSVFDGYSPGDKVLVTLQLVTVDPS